MLSYFEDVCGRNSLKNNAGKTEGATVEGCAVIKVSINLAKIEVMQDEKRKEYSLELSKFI